MNLLCMDCGGELGWATGVCSECGADPLGYFDDVSDDLRAALDAGRDRP